MADTGNMYDWTRRQVMREFAGRVDGSAHGIILAVFSDSLDDTARNALIKSFAALEYGPDACTFAQVDGLEPGQVFRLVEGIDPLCLVACDAQAAGLCAQAVRQEFPLLRPVRLFGRDARAFSQLNSQLETEAGRQAVWRLLKTLPRG